MLKPIINFRSENNNQLKFLSYIRHIYDNRKKSRFEDFKPIFIVGCPRSGTTLLAALLDRHPEIAIPPETTFLPFFEPYVRVNRKFDHVTVVDRCAAHSGFKYMQLKKSKLLEEFRTVEPNFKNLFQIALLEYANRQGKSRPGEKTPSHIHFVPVILNWYPKAKIVCIVRDGRDVVLSLMKKPFSFTNLRQLSHFWRVYIQCGRGLEIKYPGSFYQLRYEDLLLSPGEELTRLCEFLDVAYNPKMLDSSTKSKPVRVGAYWVERANKPIDLSRIARWKEATTTKQKVLMNSVMGPELRQLGYSDTYVGTQNIWQRLSNAALNYHWSIFYRPVFFHLGITLRSYLIGLGFSNAIRKFVALKK